MECDAQKVSIVIPTYNRAQLLMQSVNSCLVQTHRNIEIIIIDDGSTDDTYKRIGKINDDRIRYYRIEKAGAQVARNMGLAFAEGEFVKMLDSDDVMHPEALSLQVSNYQNSILTEKDVVCGYHQVIDQNGKQIRCIIPSRPVRVKGYFDLIDVVRRNPPTSTPLYRKSLLRDVGGFDPNIPVLQDYDLAFRVASAGYHYRYFPQLIYSMRAHNEDIRVSTARAGNNIDAHLGIIDRQLDVLTKRYNGVFPKSLQYALFERIAATSRKLAHAGHKDSACQLLKLLWIRKLHGNLRGYLLAASTYVSVRT